MLSQLKSSGVYKKEVRHILSKIINGHDVINEEGTEAKARGCDYHLNTDLLCDHEKVTIQSLSYL
jgi:hypothetical protein